MPSKLTVVLVSLLLATPALMFWLYLVIVPARVAILCPEGCRCDTGGYNVICKFLSVNPIPLIQLTNIQVFRLHKNNITSLEKDSFVSMTELLILDVRWCDLRTIQLGAFNGLTKLTQLSMRFNNIGEILTGTFENMKRLDYLDLSNNKLQCVDSAVFSDLFNLKYVDLSANHLQYLHPNTFLSLPNIKHLHLKRNRYLQIPTDRNFINSHSLSQLDISNCNISSLSVETFANVSAMGWLDLGENNMKTVDINILRALPKLSALLLYGNPLQCDCQLQEVWRWCKDRNIRTVDEARAPKCDTPSEVKGKWWGVLQKGQCLDGNIQYFGDYKNTNYNETDIGVYKYEYEYEYEYEINYDYGFFKQDQVPVNESDVGQQEYQYDYGNDYDVEFFKEYQLPVYIFPCVFGTTGNVILLIIIISNKDMRTFPNMFILNLAISDIIYLMVFFSEACANAITRTWVKNEFMCIFVSFCRRMSVGLSAYSVALYSFQRYRVTVNPFQVHVSSQPKWRGIVATFCGVWTVAVLFAVPSTVSKNLCELFWNVGLMYYEHVVIFELLVSCVLPLCVIAFSYIMTARHLVVSSRAISEGTQNPQLKIRRNAAKIVLGLTVVFVISYVPYHVFWTYFICSQEDISSSNTKSILDYSHYKFQYTYLISNCFLSINSCLNPVALFCTSSPFRQHLKRYLTCFCRTSSPSTDFELARRN